MAFGYRNKYRQFPNVNNTTVFRVGKTVERVKANPSLTKRRVKRVADGIGK